MDIARILDALNSLARTGWMIRGIPPSIAETVSQHSYASSIIALYLAEKLGKRGVKVDLYKAAVLALLHDLPEAFTGDILRPFSIEHIPRKEEIELAVLEREVELESIKRLYREYVEQTTVESRIARLADYIATYIQAVVYKEKGYRVDDIIAGVRKRIEELAENLGISDAVRYILGSKT
ncbi:MAG: phosphohydrolase [Thermoprotei archaeon]|nr:MAG: phosphohydrolase [Thermoprotei archaeon]